MEKFLTRACTLVLVYQEIAVSGSIVMPLEVDTGMTLGQNRIPSSTFTYLHSILAPKAILHNTGNATNGYNSLSFHLGTQK